MKRAFISLYVVIVVAILVVGWGMDKLWNYYHPEDELSDYEYSLFQLLEQQLQGAQGDELQAIVDEINANNLLRLSVYTLDELAETHLSEAIVSGDAVVAVDSAGNRHSYKRIAHSDNVIALKQQAKANAYETLYFIFLLVFYLCLALVVYFWVWPLSRDLNRLEKQTRQVGSDGAAPIVNLGRGSHVQHLADAFNAMSTRIKELLSSRKEMTYAVSHELRTPLARMKFALEMADESLDEREVRRRLLSVREDVGALDKFVSELLAYASFDQSQHSLNLQRGDLVGFCQSIVEQQSHADKSVSLCAEDDVVYVNCDWPLMEHVLNNLLQNALRYAEKIVQVSVEQQDDVVCIAVEDDGVGIPDRQKKEVFQAFTRLQQAEQGVSGYGLGLAIVRRVIQWHGAAVYVEDSSLGGARFVIVL